MRIRSILASTAALAMTVAPVAVSANPASKLSVANASARAAAPAKGQKAAGGGVIVAVLAAAAVIAGIVIIADSNDDADSN